MRGRPTSFWAKLADGADGAVVGWHPLLDHCADVGACAEALLEQRVLRRRLARLAGLGDLSRTQRSRLACLAALHDLGKFNTGFQNRGFPGRHPRAGHVREVLALFGGEKDGQRLADALDVEDFLRWGDDEVPIRCLVAVLSHHGRPIPMGGKHTAAYWKAGPFGDPFDGVKQLARAVRSWFPAAFEDSSESPPTSSTFLRSGLLDTPRGKGTDAGPGHHPVA